MITYHKGPLGWGVSKDGRQVGLIRWAPVARQWLVSVEGFKPGHDPATRGKHLFPSLKLAKAKVEAVLA